MDFFDLLTMIGGLALFLYGMHLLSEGLEKLSGGRLERVLENLTNNRIKAVLLGAGVTAVIQSSSATTVMVVGFVNSGIMKLSQAIGIIMGANVGTTITSWLLSLTGIESDNFLLQLVKPTSFSPILAVIGVVFILFVKTWQKARSRFDFSWLCNIDDRNGYNVVGYEAVESGSMVYRAFYNVYESSSWIACRSTYYSSHSVLLSICWYFAGIMCDGKY